MASLLDGGSHDERRVWPLSLLCYKHCIHRLSLDRRMQPVDSINIRERLGDQGQDVDPDSVKSQDTVGTSKDDRIATQDNKPGDKSSVQDAGRRGKVEFMCGQYHDLYHVYRRHVKPKKQHEIHQLGQVIKQLSECCQCKQIVDIGAGLGHLSRLLTFGQELKVTTVEATSCHAPKASTFDRQMKEEIKKKKYRKKKPGKEEEMPSTNKKNDHKLPSHIVHWIEPSMPLQEFLRILNPDICDQTDGHTGDKSYAFRDQNSDQTDGHTGDESCAFRDQNSDQTDRSAGEKFYAHGDQTSDQTDGHVGKKPIARLDLNSTAGHVRRKPYQPMDKNSDGTSVHVVDTQMCPATSDFTTADSDSGISLTQKKVTGKDPRKRGYTRENASGELNHHDEAKGEQTLKQFVLCGLHACGNLSSTILKLFVNCPLAVGVSSVGCCYMKLSCDSTRSNCQPEDIGYPMSETLRSLPNHELSYTAREMACHFVDSYTERLKENGPNLIVHSYRAALQEIILEKDPSFQRGAMKVTMKKAEEMPFHKYAEACLKKLGLAPDLSEAGLHHAQTNINRWRDVVAFYTLRLALAPVIETLILLDRQLYLLEHGFNSILVPVFEPSVSPRNFVLLARK